MYLRFYQQVVNAAIIVDPSVRQVIANACDQTCGWDNPPGKCVGDFTAHEPDSNGAAISEPSFSDCIGDDNGHRLSYTGVSCLYPRRWTEHRPCAGSPRYLHPLRHAALVAIEYAAERDRRLFPGSHSESRPIQEDDMQSSSMRLPAKRQKTDTAEDDSDMVLKICANNSPSEAVRPYLCTGFDIYLTDSIRSRTAMSRKQIQEVGEGLVRSGCGFMWVAKDKKVVREEEEGVEEVEKLMKVTEVTVKEKTEVPMVVLMKHMIDRDDGGDGGGGGSSGSGYGRLWSRWRLI
ncbi:tRNA-specific adenosine deaminase TAD3-like [Macadamia integrifolia]|uniref:tRNA-specific adenosine deaminase TAD3-like n=1 Tax=Macadamia integrifolia TaxID=60698 RepID=UPI001C529CA8|nr:tRNA-specific adenosine deaminase TAD3-like [Macadamia integrifolia]